VTVLSESEAVMELAKILRIPLSSTTSLTTPELARELVSERVKSPVHSVCRKVIEASSPVLCDVGKLCCL
jgi:hypothetical protein